MMNMCILWMSAQQHLMSLEFGARKDEEGRIATYQAQVSLSLRILVMMGTLFAAGFCGNSDIHLQVLLSVIAVPAGRQRRCIL